MQVGSTLKFSIYVTAVPHVKYYYGFFLGINFINDSIVSDTNSIELVGAL